MVPWERACDITPATEQESSWILLESSSGEPRAAGQAERGISCPAEPPKTASRRRSKSRCALQQLHGLVQRANCFIDIPNKNNSTLLQGLFVAEESCIALTSNVQPPFPCPFWLDVLFPNVRHSSQPGPLREQV